MLFVTFKGMQEWDRLHSSERYVLNLGTGRDMLFICCKMMIEMHVFVFMYDNKNICLVVARHVGMQDCSIL